MTRLFWHRHSIDREFELAGCSWIGWWWPLTGRRGRAVRHWHSTPSRRRWRRRGDRPCSGRNRGGRHQPPRARPVKARSIRVRFPGQPYRIVQGSAVHSCKSEISKVEQGRVTYLLQVEQRVVRAAPHHPTVRNRRPPALGGGFGEGGTVARERLLAVGPHLRTATRVSKGRSEE